MLPRRWKVWLPILLGSIAGLELAWRYTDDSWRSSRKEKLSKDAVVLGALGALEERVALQTEVEALPQPQTRISPVQSTPAAVKSSALATWYEDQLAEIQAKKWPSLKQPCKKKHHDPSSRPGRPCLPEADPWPFTQKEDWRIELGEKAVLAATGVVSKKQCGGFFLFGDMTWCLNAVQTRVGNEQPDGGVIGLSYGIEQRDLWSELMSNKYQVPTRLYDCFQRPEDSPPLGGKAQNGTGTCPTDGPACYNVPYQAYQICSGPVTGKFEGRKYESLEQHLKDRSRLSVHLKIDTEGSEWEVLEWFLNSPHEMDKVRTLDMEVHLGWMAASSQGHARHSMSVQQRLEFDIDILLRLGKHFRCTGSSMEVLSEGWARDEREGGKCKQCREPNAHAAGGWDVIQFAISFVHPALLRDGGSSFEAP